MSTQELIREKTKVSGQEAYLLSLYLDELWKWNQRINLVGVSSIDRVIDELLIDSLMAREFLPEKGSLLDIGSGAGFPAIPLKVAKQGMIFHLVEARRKRAAFLKQVIRKMGLKDIHVFYGRIEDIKEGLFPSYDRITFRGIRLIDGLKLSLPYLADGIIISFQGADFRVILNEAKAFMEENRIKIAFIKEYSISKRRRALILFKKA